MTAEFRLEQALYVLEQRTDHHPQVVNSLWRGVYASCPCGWEYQTYSNHPLAGLLAQMKADDHANGRPT